jgi:hypothetical protein
MRNVMLAVLMAGCAGTEAAEEAAVQHGDLVADIHCDQEFGGSLLTYEARAYSDGATVVTCEVETGGKSQTGTATYQRSEGHGCKAGTWQMAWSIGMGVLAKDGAGANQLMTECGARKVEGGALKSTGPAYVFKE